MLFIFVSPEPDGRVVDIPIEADSLHAAFIIFEKKHWDVYRNAFGVWCHGDLIARVYTVRRQDGKEACPLYHPVKPPLYAVAGEPSEN